MAGGGYSLFKITEVLDGRYLRPPDVAMIPCEFCRVEYMTGRLQGRTFDQRAPRHRLGNDGRHRLYRGADGVLTDFGRHEERQLELNTELRALERRRTQIVSELRGVPA